MLDLTPPNKRPPKYFAQPSPQDEPSSHLPAVSNVLFWLAFIPTTGALLISGYLSFVSLVLGVAPAGCGAGSGCGQVLASHYATIMGLPVSIPALGVYVPAIVLLLLVKRRKQNAQTPAMLRALLVLAAGVIFGSVIWFTFLQFFVLREACFYCMLSHALGTWAAIMLLLIAIRMDRSSTSADATHAPTADRALHAHILLPLLLGLGFSGIFALAQWSQPEIVRYIELPTQGDYDLTDRRGRHIGLLDGEVTFTVQDMPHDGSLDAQHVLVLMYDYACPHCRTLHHMAGQMVRDGELDALLVYMPMAIHPACNPYMAGALERFDQSCALAHISLTIFLASREDWQAFDGWMFQTQQPRTVAQARDYVAEHISATLLDDPQWQEPAAALLEANIEAFGSIPVVDPVDRRVPVTLAPHARPIMGPIHQRQTLLQFLQSRENATR